MLVLGIPGDLADRGVAVNFRTTSVEKQQGEDWLDIWTRIPKHIVAESAAEGFEERHREPIMSELHRWSGTHNTQQCDYVERGCKSLADQMNAKTFEVHHDLEAVKLRHNMIEQS